MGSIVIRAAANYRLGRFTLEPRRQLLRDGRPVAVGGKALDLLSVLAEAAGSLVTKDEMMAAVWPGIVVEENAIQVHISAARRALEDEADRLTTVRGRGYRLAVDERGDAAPLTSIAVLAFANLTGDPADQFISDGIAEELITTLHRSGGLRIPSRTSAFAYRNRDLDIRAIGRELNVEAVLEGSVRKSGDRIRVTAQLIETGSGFHLWAQSFDRDDSDLLALQDDLAAAIGRAVNAKIGSVRFRTNDPEAFRLNMRARALAGRATPEALARAIELQRQAIALDPGYANAWAGLAGTLSVATSLGVIPPDGNMEARLRAEEAIRLDRGAAAPYAIRAVLDVTAGAWLDAERGFSAALELDAASPTAREAFAFRLLAPVGLVERAGEEVARAVADAPATPNAYLTQGLIASVRGDHAGAVVALEMAQMLGTSDDRSALWSLRSDVARVEGRWEEAGAHAAAAALRWPGLENAADLARQVFAAAGNAEAGTVSEPLRRFVEGADDDGSLWRVPGAVGQIMLWQMLLDSVDNIYAITARMMATWRRTGQLASISLNQLWRPEMKPFRDDARFDALIDDLGLPPLWRRIGAPSGYAQIMRGEKIAGAGGTTAA